MSAQTQENAWSSLHYRLGTDQALLESFSKDPIPPLTAAGIAPPATPPSDYQPSAPKAAAEESEHCWVDTSWWGVSVNMNERLTNDIVYGLTPTAALSALIAGAFGAAGVLTAGVATVVGGAFAVAVGMKIAQIKITDGGSGVYWPITWPQMGAVAVAVPAGPPAILLALLVFIHPVRL